MPILLTHLKPLLSLTALLISCVVMFRELRKSAALQVRKRPAEDLPSELGHRHHAHPNNHSLKAVLQDR